MISRRPMSRRPTWTFRWKSTLVVLLGHFLVSGANAERLALQLEPERTRIAFELGATLHTVHGTARLAGGEIELESEGGPATGLVVIDATTLETGNPSRDRKMHRKVLVSETYPEIRLEVLATEGSVAERGTSSVVLVSRFVMAGEAHPIEIAAEVVRSQGDARADQVAFEARFEVPYVEWGLRDPSTFVLRVAKVVTVTLEGEATLSPPSE